MKQTLDIEEVRYTGQVTDPLGDMLTRIRNAAQALKRAHTAHILETGEIVRSGTGAELAGDDSVKAAYLGGDV